VGLARPTPARPRCGSRLTHAEFGETQAVGSRGGGGGLVVEGAA
jgi:hypothetical protein